MPSFFLLESLSRSTSVAMPDGVLYAADVRPRAILKRNLKRYSFNTQLWLTLYITCRRFYSLTQQNVEVNITCCAMGLWR